MRNLLLDVSAQPIINLAGRPRNISSAGFRHSNTAAVGTRAQNFQTTTGPVDRGWWMWTWSTAAVGPVGGLDLLVSEAPNQPPVTPGNPYSVAILVLSSRSTVLRAQAQFINSGGGNAGVVNGPDIAVPANIPTVLTVENAIPVAGAVSLRADVDHSGGAALWQVGDVFKVGSVSIVDGPKAYVPTDGGTPGWRWLSDPAQSTGAMSAGYPYTLESIAGVPFINSVNSSNSAITFDSRTFPNGASLYMVGDRPVAGDAYGAAIRDNASTQRLYAIASTTVGQAAGQVAGVANQTAVNTTSIPQGMGIISATTAANQAFVRVAHNAVTGTFSTNIEGAPGVLTADRLAKSAVGTGRHIHQIVYDSYHTPEQAVAITKWLCNTYGLPFVP